MVNEAHNVIKYLKRTGSKYLSLVRRVGKKRAMVATVRILVEKTHDTKKGREIH